MKKEWYKTWWGGIVAVLFFPIFAIWFIWAKAQFSKNMKIVATVALVVALGLVGAREKAMEPKLSPQELALKEEEERKAEEFERLNTLTTEEMVGCKTTSERMVRDVLKSPSTAKFPGMDDWRMSKKDGIIYVRSYVDAQNSFGAMLRSDFSLIFDTNTGNITSFTFDGQKCI